MIVSFLEFWFRISPVLLPILKMIFSSFDGSTFFISSFNFSVTNRQFLIGIIVFVFWAYRPILFSFWWSVVLFR